ncbi:MAG: two-component system LytT family response regulator [Urechidicola sp.]|jgi:two-component system LytT family response regulator|tara:strand:+ start:562 stop:876 length:315 start_codon:yes stop_codon:yes gene_type:complete
MPNYADYKIINFIKEIDFEIIFLTTFDNYAIKVFELIDIDYLVKPISREKKVVTLSKLTSKFYSLNKMEVYQYLLESIKADKFDTIIIPELGNKTLVKLKKMLL